VGLWTDSILPRLIDVGMRGEKFREQRDRCVGRVHGRVLELGFGSGLNLPHYPDGVTELLALEPSEVGRKLASKRVEAAPFQVEYVGLDGAEIPLDAGSVDFVTCTWTLCVIPDVDSALKEVRRVLRPGGSFRFVEHGASRVEEVRRLQDRLNGLQRFVAGGCNLNREIDRLVERAGFSAVDHEEYTMPGPRFLSSLYAGAATR
jgi:ubiquinone/menaquinone biosynthesis C-methylase UbiE